MTWKYRILAHEQNGVLFFQIHEVYYNLGILSSYKENAEWLGANTPKEISWHLAMMRKGSKKPILWAGVKFPMEYTGQISEE